MRYPLWAFFFVLILPPFTAHALLIGKADLAPMARASVLQTSQATPYWTHRIVAAPSQDTGLILY